MPPGAEDTELAKVQRRGVERPKGSNTTTEQTVVASSNLVTPTKILESLRDSRIFCFFLTFGCVLGF